jgi:hypothetical protein
VIRTIDTPAALKRALPGGQILDLSARTPAPLSPRLTAIPGVLRVEPEDATLEDGVERLRLIVDPAYGLHDRVLHAERESGADLQHVSLNPPSLEDVYIHLTGKDLRE